MANQQKGVRQDTAYSAVVANVSPSLPISFFHVSMTHFWSNDIMIIRYNCNIGSILLHSFLLICHPYPHENDFYTSLVPLRRAWAHITYACALAQTAPLLSRPIHFGY